MSRGQGLNKRRAFLLSLQQEMHPCCMHRLINRKGQRWGVRVRGVERQKAVSKEKERKEMKWQTKRPNVRTCDDSQKTLIWRGGSRMCEESQERDDLLEAAMSEVLLCVWHHFTTIPPSPDTREVSPQMILERGTSFGLHAKSCTVYIITWLQHASVHPHLPFYMCT